MMDNGRKDFWTKQIRLEEISRADYSAFRRGWGNETSEKNRPVSDTYARIIKPLASDDYLKLVDTFLKHPAARQINVLEQNWGWHKFSPNLVSPALSAFIAGVAENDPFGYDFLEMRFQPVQLNAEGIKERAKIVFREAGDMLLGYRIKVHRDN